MISMSLSILTILTWLFKQVGMQDIVHHLLITKTKKGKVKLDVSVKLWENCKILMYLCKW